MQHPQMLHEKFAYFQIGANNTQHVATGWPNARNILHPTMLRHVALACCNRLAGALSSQSIAVNVHSRHLFCTVALHQTSFPASEESNTYEIFTLQAQYEKRNQPQSVMLQNQISELNSKAMISYIC